MTKTFAISIAVGLLLCMAIATGASAADAPHAAQVVPTPSPSRQISVDQLERMRLQQTLALLKTRQPAEIDFAGTVGKNAAGLWTVAGLAIRPTSNTAYEGALATGLHAHVRAQIHADGTLAALHIHTMTHASNAARHAEEWAHDDHGVHLGGCQAPTGSDHLAEEHPADAVRHPDHPDHAAPVATPQPSQPVHHPDAPTQAPTQPGPFAPQPGHHGEGSSGGDHSSGHD